MTPRRFASGIAVTALGALVLVRVALTLLPPTRTAWNLVSVGADTSALWLRISQADTGVYAGQLTTRLAWIPQSQRTLVHRAMHGPGTFDEAGAVAGADRIRREGDRWDIAVGSLELQARARLDRFRSGCPPEAGWLSGNLQAGEEGSLLEGTAVVVRTRAVGRVEGAALYVLGRDVAIGVDPLADCPAWVRIAERTWTGDVRLPAGNRGEVRLGAWTVRWQAIGVPVTQEGLAHVTPPERWLAWLAGFPEPVQVLRRASVRIDGPGVDLPRTGIHITRRVR